MGRKDETLERAKGRRVLQALEKGFHLQMNRTSVLKTQSCR